ncbi:MAG: TRAM domain-containing protein [Lentisphaerae bacterium]|nr:TRAM domain-containing protein [Lentisphaerota bacterium]
MKANQMPTPPPDEAPIDLTIGETAYRGAGVARQDGWVVFVPGAWPGERVKVQITRRKRQYGEGRVVEVLDASPHRIAPACPLAGTCPGCAYQLVAYAEEVRLKQAQLARFLSHQAAVTASMMRVPIASPRELGYRNKIVLHAATGAGGPVLGYVAADNTSVLDVMACPLALPPLAERLAALRADATFMQALRSEQSVTLRYTELDGALHWVGRPAPGAPWLQERTGLGPVWVPRGGFFQVNPGAADLLLDTATQWLRAVNPRAVVDLFCGVGMFALAAAAAGVTSVSGVDVDAVGIRAAKENAARLQATGVRFASGPAEALARKALAQFPADGTLLIVDPPRLGLAKSLVADILRAAPAHLLYISCAADTLARDLAALVAGGYRVTDVQLVDMFPRTAYFETLVLLAR